MFMTKFYKVFSSGFSAFCLMVLGSACAHQKVDNVSAEDASRIDRKLVKESVVYEPGAKEGASVPDVSAPRLRAVWVEERIEGNRLIEAHREWLLEGDVSLLGIPKAARKAK